MKTNPNGPRHEVHQKNWKIQHQIHLVSFNLLYKLHKETLKKRPVCSDYASLPHALAMWVDEMLLQIMTCQPTYFKDSFTLMRELNILKLPENASLFTYNAISMYTKIDTTDCIAQLSTFLLDSSQQQTFKHYPPNALVKQYTL